nr:MAG TPA: hypothetical protein [Caudoviricetes sp.]
MILIAIVILLSCCVVAFFEYLLPVLPRGIIYLYRKGVK